MDELRRGIAALLPKLRRVAWALTQHEADSLDLLQATVERALSNEAGAPRSDRLGYWMLRIMKNLWIDEIRKRRRWQRIVTPMPEDSDPSDGGDAVAVSERHVELARVRQVLETMPEDHRLAIQLAVMGDLSYREAAEFLDISVGAFTSRLARARADLLQTLKAQETS